MSSPAAPSPSRLTRQPWKFLYSALTVATLPLRLLAIFLYYAPRSLRQHPKWTYHQAVGKHVFSLWWEYATTVEYRTAKTLKPGLEKDRFVVMTPPVAGEGVSPYRGIVDRDPSVRPGTIGGVWYSAPPPPGETPKRVVIHFHGGAYVLGGARTMESGGGPWILSQRLGCPVLLPQYRLSVEDSSPFPAALQDGITAYAYVLNTLKVPATQVIFSGDSAGGNLVVAMVRYLSEEGKAAGLPLPRAALLWSPWLDLTADPSGIDNHPNRATDYIFGSLVAWGVRRYTPAGWSSGHRYLSPLGNEFHSEVPMFIQTGTAEVLYQDHVRFAEGMKAEGTRVELVDIKLAPHDTFAAGLVLGFAKEAEDTIIQATKFVNEAGSREDTVVST